MPKNTQKEFEQLKDKTFIITTTISQEEISKEYDHVLSHVAADIEIKGFRKGKAPLDVVEAHIDSNKIFEQVAESLLSKIYSDKIKEHNLKPIIQPQVKILNPPISKDKEWQIEIKGCELPEIELAKLEEKIKKVNSSEVKETKDGKSAQEQQLDKIFETILETSKVELPEILVDADIQGRLGQLVEQTSQAGLTVSQYLKSQNTTIEKYQEEVKKQVVKEWTLNLAIDKIAQDNKIEVGQKELEELVSKNPKTATNINMLAYVLRQQKVLEFLQKLK